jgi:glycosyltransferase involved in cell wall biosynthesis
VRHPFNLGYGAALQTGYKAALDLGASYVAQMDADGQHDPENIAKLLAPIVEDRCDVVVGSRFKDETGYQMGVIRSIGRKVFASIARLAGLHVSDPTSGFQAMNRHVLELYAGDFFPADYPDVDVLLTAYRHGMRVGEESVQMSEGVRPSTMHGGWGSFYYVYKMLLSIWAGSGSRRRTRTAKPGAPILAGTKEDTP